MPNTIAKEREEDEHRVLTSRCQAVCDLFVRHDPFHETFLLHLPESAGEDARRQPRIVAQDLPKPRQLQERHVPQDEQRPFAPEPFDALADRIRLVRQERVDLAFILPGISPPSHHYPSGPYQAYILSNGYHFARPRAYDGTEEDPNGIRRGRLDGFLRVFEHRSGRDPELLGEGFRLALRVREVPHGRLPLVPNARRWARRHPTGAGERGPGEHELRARRRPRCGANEGRAGGWADRLATRGCSRHGELLLVPRARWPDPRGMARCPRVADGA